MSQDHPPETNEFLREANAERIGFFAEFRDFLRHNKKYWLIPILLAIALLVVLIILMTTGGGAAAPFIYPLF